MLIYDSCADISKDASDVIVNTVNTVGVMGAGVAKAVRLRYPDIMAAYTAICDGKNQRSFEPGCISLFKTADQLVVNMATKEHWKDPSQYDWVGSGLVYLNRLLVEKLPNTKSVLLPAPGCGKGGLEWPRVHRMIQTYLKKAIDNGIQITVSSDAPEQVLDPITFAGVGSRKTPDDILDVMFETSGILADRGWHLRTGEAKGADSAFREAYEEADAKREIFTVKNRPDLSGIYDIRPTHLRMVQSIHPKPEALSKIARDLMARNGSQVFGLDFTAPSDIVICWTPEGRGEGGTGQAIRLATSVGIPVLDLGSPEYTDITAQDVVELSVKMVEAHRVECGIQLPEANIPTHSPAP